MSESAPDLFTGEGLAVLRGERLLFKGLDFALPAGRALVLRGANGSGKTTLLRIMAGFTRPLAGRITWGGEAVQEQAASHRARVAFIGHRAGLKEALTVRESVRFDAGMRALEGMAAQDAMARLGLEALADLPIRLLSAGQRRRVALTRLALGGARLWLLDEPATALDAANEDMLWRLCRERLEAGDRAVIASHGAVPLEGSASLEMDRHAP